MVYPTLLERFKALVLDAGIIIVSLIAAGLVFQSFPEASGTVRGLVLIGIYMLYEPVMVSLGGTIGHRVFGMVVRSHADRNRKVMFPLALVRSLVKWLLGWLSFISMIGNEERRSVHDIASRSIVLYKEEIESEEVFAG